MDALKELLLIFKTIQPGAQFVIAIVAVSWAISKVAPYIFKAEEAKNVLKTKKVEAAAEQVKDENQQENTWLAIFEKQTTIQERSLKLLDDIEQRTQNRHVESMKLMQDVKTERDAKIDAIQQTIKTVPSLVIEAQQPHLSALDNSIQTAIITFEKNVIARLERAEEYIPTAVKATVAEVIREELSKLVIKGNEQNGNNTGTVANVGDSDGHNPDGAGNSPVIDGTDHAVGVEVPQLVESSEGPSGVSEKAS